MSLFQMPISKIQELITQLQLDRDLERGKNYEKYQDFYLGGDRIKKYLDKHRKESAEQYRKRQERLADLNYTAALADQLIDALYGYPVERRIEGTDSQIETFQGVLDDNWIDLIQRDIGWSMIVLGDAFLRIWWDEQEEMLRLQPVHPANILVLPDERDPLRPALLIEIQSYEYTQFKKQKRTHYTIWTPEKVGTLDQDGRWVTAPQDNPYDGVIPYVHWRGRGMMGSYWGTSAIRSVVTMQQMIHNRTSMLDRVILMQTHGQLVVLSEEKTEITSSEDAFLPLRPGEDAKYINPNAAIDEVQGSIERLIDRLFEVGRVPVSAVKGGQANSGFQLVMEYVPMERLVRAYRQEAIAAEYQLIDTICWVGSRHGLDLPEVPEFSEVSFKEAFLPADKKAEFERDLFMLNNHPPLMTRKRFLRKWGPEGMTDEELEQYIAELDQERGQPALEQPPEVGPVLEAL
jgi:hypothetical protein